VIGQRLGPYEVIAKLGEGGMGGRADSLLEGKSYDLDEVEAVVGVVRASLSEQTHLFLFDELFRAPMRSSASRRVRRRCASWR
jgi:hypothetical protein